MSRINHVFASKLAVTIASSLLLTAMQPARAGNHGAQFREFRQQNLGLDRHAARRLYRSEGNTANPRGRAENQIQVFRNTIQLNEAGNAVRLRGGINLDLTSNLRSIALGKNMFQGMDSIQITDGAQTKTLTAGSVVSAAEYIAAKQVLAGGQQLTVRNGRATGGEVDLDAITGDHDVMRAANLVVSKDVTTIGDFSRRSEFKLLGDLNNYGTVLATASDASTRSGAIRADDINNFSGATINSTVDLTLDASGKITNAGSINSSAGLTLAAGTAVNNSGTIGAQNDVSVLSSQLNNIRGSIASTTGNVNIDAASDATLVINNQRGTVSAANGAINVRNASYNGAADTYLQGGDWLSKELNLNSGQGTTNTVVDELTGIVNQTGTAAHLLASTANLTIGDVCLAGDPTYYNTVGGITLQGSILVGEELTIVAAGDILTTTGATIQAGDANTKGFDITLIAGAGITADPLNNVSVVGPIPPANPSNGAVTLTGKASKTGGGVIFADSTTVTARAVDTSGNTDGGDISIYAFGGKSENAGKFLMSQALPALGALLSGGSGTGTNGNVTVIAGAKDDTPIVITSIDTTGGSGAGGDINLFTFGIAPTDKKIPVTYGADGKLTSSSSLFVSKITSGNIQIRDSAAASDLNAAGKITLTAGDQLLIQGGLTAEDTITLSANAMINTAAPPITSLTNIVLSTSKGNIGSNGAPLSIATPALTANSGADMFIQVFGSGGLDVDRLQSKSALTLRADGKDLSVDSLVSGGTVRLVANTFVAVEDLVGKTSLDLVQKIGDLSNAPFNTVITTPVLNLVASTGKIGSDPGNPFFIPVGVKTVSAVAVTDGEINLAQNGKALAFGTIDGGKVSITSNNSVTFTHKVTATTLDTVLSAGSITVKANIAAVDNVSLTNQSIKGKIVVAKEVDITTNSATDGDISLTILPISAAPVTLPIPNVTINPGSGVVTITGAGLKAKSPTNILDPFGADIIINNGARNSNISLGGDANIRAD